MLVALVGPTATGKSDLALALALDVAGRRGEVVNADASQLYRGMDLGTAKVTPGERMNIAHHLFDVLDIDQEASVAVYQRGAHAVCAVVRERGHVPLLTGGSGLYVRAVIDSLEFPGTDPVVRGRLEAEADTVGSPELHARLATLDPVAAESIVPTNARRLVRALEVIEITGRPFSATMPDYGPRPGTVQIGLDLSPDDLDARIATRVHVMVQRGLVDEVKALAAAGLRDTRTASRAIGYQQVLAHLAGECSLDEAVEATIRATRRLVRRQRSWFRRDPRVHWLDAAAPDLVERARHIVEDELSGAPPG